MPKRAAELTARSQRRSLQTFHQLQFTNGRTLVVAWFTARLIVFLLWAVITPGTQGDVLYYYEGITKMFHEGPQEAMREYPTPVLWLLAIPWLLGFGTSRGYVTCFVLLMLFLDASFAYGLWRWGGRLRAHAVTYWIVFLMLCGPTAYLRFDLVTAVLAGWALLLLARGRPGIAGGLAGIGAAVKLWPALLWPALCGGTRKQKWQATLGFWGTGGLLALGSLLWAGWPRLVSPLGWQSGRGLQVESIWATVPMLMRALGIGDYAVLISRFQAFEVYGTGVRFWVAAADISMVLGLLAITVGYLRWIIRGRGDHLEAAVLMLLVVLVMIVTNKTFSPQYIIWLGGPMAAAFAMLAPRQRETIEYFVDRRRLWTTSVLLLASTGLTVLVYPLGYGALVRDSWPWLMQFLVTVVLVVRNVLMLVLTISVLQWMWAFLSPTALSAASPSSPASATPESTSNADTAAALASDTEAHNGPSPASELAGKISEGTANLNANAESNPDHR